MDGKMLSRRGFVTIFALAVASAGAAMSAEQTPLFEVIASEQAMPGNRVELTLTLVNRTQRPIDSARVEVLHGGSGITSVVHVTQFPDGVDTAAPHIPLPGTLGITAGEPYLPRVAWIKFPDGSELSYRGASGVKRSE